MRYQNVGGTFGIAVDLRARPDSVEEDEYLHLENSKTHCLLKAP
jgi:hypothetical protein